VPWRVRGVRPLLLRRRASRPQLKRDPLGGGILNTNPDSNSTSMEVTVEATVPQADLFARQQPAITEGPATSWQLARTLIDFGSAVLAARAPCGPTTAFVTRSSSRSYDVRWLRLKGSSTF